VGQIFTEGEADMTGQLTIMVVSADLENRRNIARILDSQGFDPVCVANVRECGEILGKQGISLIFCDRKLADGDYRDIQANALAVPQKQKPRVVVMSALMKPEEYQEAKSSGVFEVIGVPCRPTNIEWAIILAKRDERNRMKQPLRITSFNSSRGNPAAAGAS
jgi:CheY-like chemotaxis protein